MGGMITCMAGCEGENGKKRGMEWSLMICFYTPPHELTTGKNVRHLRAARARTSEGPTTFSPSHRVSREAKAFRTGARSTTPAQPASPSNIPKKQEEEATKRHRGIGISQEKPPLRRRNHAHLLLPTRPTNHPSLISASGSSASHPSPQCSSRIPPGSPRHQHRPRHSSCPPPHRPRAQPAETAHYSGTPPCPRGTAGCPSSPRSQCCTPVSNPRASRCARACSSAGSCRPSSTPGIPGLRS